MVLANHWLQHVCAILLALAVFAPGRSATAAQTKDKDLVAHYDFEGGGEAITRDKSGHGHDGKIHGAKRVKVEAGSALRFDGVDDHVDCGTSPALKFTGSFSIELWVKHGNDLGWQVYVGDYIGGKTGYVIAQKDGALYFHNGGLKPYTLYDEEPVIQAGVWHHVAAVYDQPGGKLLTYVDGIERASADVKGVPKPSASIPLQIGRYHDGREYLNGLIDDVRIYKRVLSEAEIMVRYTSHQRSQQAMPDRDGRPPSLADIPGGVLMGMALKRVKQDNTGITAVTTGAEFLLAKTGQIRCFQRIPVRREVARLTIPEAYLPLELKEKDDFACKIAGKGIALTIQGDSLLILQAPKGMKLTFEGLFRPAYHAHKDGRYLFIDPHGGFGVYPAHGQKTTAPSLAKPPWSVAYDLKRREEIWVSVFPPRPHNWERSFESLAHEGGRNPLEKYAYPSDELIRDTARFCKVFAVHSYIFPGGDKPPWLIPAFVPSDMARFRRMRDEIHRCGMKLVPYFSPYYYRGPDFFAEIRRGLDEHKIDGLYFDGVSHDFRKSYRIVRRSRQMLGDDRVLYIHASTDPLGSIQIYCPFIDTYADYMLRGEAGRGALERDDFLRWIVSGYNISNAVGLWCYYGSTGAAGYVHKVPASADIDAALKNHVRLWRTKVAWETLGRGDVDAFDKEYYTKLAKLRTKVLGK